MKRDLVALKIYYLTFTLFVDIFSCISCTPPFPSSTLHKLLNFQGTDIIISKIVLISSITDLEIGTHIVLFGSSYRVYPSFHHMQVQNYMENEIDCLKILILYTYIVFFDSFNLCPRPRYYSLKLWIRFPQNYKNTKKK